MNDNLPDVQETMKPIIESPIKQVGVENIKLNFMLEMKTGGLVFIPANTTIKTDLKSSKKGISMSRLLLTLKPYLGTPLNHSIMFKILDKIKENIDCCEVYLKFEFDLPIMKTSILSDYEFPLFHKCFFEAQLSNGYSFIQGVKVQYASYCPCSAELSKDLVESGKSEKCGFPHAQRSYADIVVLNDLEAEKLWLEDLIELVYRVIKTQPYPIIKRVDEQEIARIASENPLFVEDAIRLISNELKKDNRILDWIVKCSHEESIHTHEAIAINWKGGVIDGFNENYFI